MRVEFDNVSVAIGAAEVVHNVTLRIETGSFVGIVGPNGSGKSTLLRTVYKALAPRGGVVRIDGRSVVDIRPDDNAKSVAALTQDSPMDFDFTAREVVETGRLPHGSTPARDAECVDRAARIARVSPLLDSSVLGLSGGERQRVLIARALAQDPRLLLLDEPSNHLDIAHQYEILCAVKELGITVVAALHDMNLAAEFCDQMHVMNSGRLVLSGTPTQVLTDSHLRAYFGIGGHIITNPSTGAPHVIFARRPSEFVEEVLEAKTEEKQ